MANIDTDQQLSLFAKQLVLLAEESCVNNSFYAVSLAESHHSRKWPSESFSNSSLKAVVKGDGILEERIPWTQIFKPFDHDDVKIGVFTERIKQMVPPKWNVSKATERQFTLYAANHILKPLIMGDRKMYASGLCQDTNCVCSSDCNMKSIIPTNNRYIGLSTTMHGELDMVIRGTRGDTAVIFGCGEPDEGESTRHESKSKKRKQAEMSAVEDFETSLIKSVAGHVLYCNEMMEGEHLGVPSYRLMLKAQFVAEAVTFGWLQHNRHENSAVPGVVTITLSPTQCGILVYYPEEDILLSSIVFQYYDDAAIDFGVNGLLLLYLALNYEYTMLPTVPTTKKTFGLDRTKNNNYGRIIQYGSSIPAYPCAPPTCAIGLDCIVPVYPRFNWQKEKINIQK